MSAFDFWFAWADATDTVFDPVAFARTDEEVFSWTVDHSEGQIPKLTIQVKNPRVGFLAMGRKFWAWLSVSINGGAAQPLFFGRLVGIPTDILANVVEMQLIARPTDYIRQKQLVAENLKKLPNYDPIFVDVAKRDDPDTIIEGWSVLYHVDRVTLAVTTSDIVIGEDATVSFHPEDVFYDSVKMKLLQSPLVAVNVKAEVQWTQAARGHFNVGQWSFPTLGNDAFVGEWPQSGASIGGGYSAGVAWAGERDPSISQTYLNNWTGKVTINYQSRNLKKTHVNGETMDVNYTADYPITVENPGFQRVLVDWAIQKGKVDATAVDSNGDPDPINIPAIVDLKYFCYRVFDLSALGKTAGAYLSLTYAAARQRTERIDLTVVAAVQPILIDPPVVEDTEQITVKSGDLGLPLIDLLSWDSVSGRAVALATIIFPDNPLVPGQASAQIAVVAGTAGTVEPIFSNVAGQTVTDGTVVWSSLGQAAPTEMAQDWVRAAPVALGTMIIPKPVTGVPDRSSMLAAGSMNYPPMGVPVSEFQVISEGFAGPGSRMYECVRAGILGGLSIDQAVFQTFHNPTGMYIYICIEAGQTGIFRPHFNETPGARTTDGTAVWQNVGLSSVPIGGYPGNTPARSYFPSDRGQLSVQNLIQRARAKLRKRARAVEINFDARFEAAAGLSCRQNAGIADIRLPGGQAYGKVIGYKLVADGQTGRVYANVTIGCSIGTYWPGNPETPPIEDSLPGANVTVDPELGIVLEEGPDYVEDGYVASGYQLYDQTLVVPVIGADSPTDQSWPPFQPGPYSTDPVPPPLVDPLGQIAYAPPVEQTTDDGIVFPIKLRHVQLSNGWHGVPSTVNPGTLAAYNDAINAAVYEGIRQAKMNPMVLPPPPIPSDFDGYQAILRVTADQPDWGSIDFQVQQAVLKSVYQGTGLWYELSLKPLDVGPFAASYVLSTSQMLIPKTIDLSAPSAGG